MILEKRQGLLLCLGWSVAFQLLIRKAVPRGSGQARLIETVHPRFEVIEGQVQRRPFAIGIWLKPREVTAHDLERCLKRGSKLRVHVFLPIRFELGIVPVERTAEEPLFGFRRAFGLRGGWDLLEHPPCELVHLEQGDRLFVDPSDAHRWKGNRDPELVPSSSRDSREARARDVLPCCEPQRC
jgi:hypothetical protein